MLEVLIPEQKELNLEKSQSIDYQTASSFIQPITFLQSRRLVVIPSNVNNYQTLSKLSNQQTIAIDYNWQETNLVGLAQKIANAVKGKKLKSIAFATHGNSTGKFELTQKDIVSIESLQNDKNQTAFWKRIGSFLEKQGRVDLFGCEIGQSRNKKVLLEHLEKLIERPIAFADHKIGSSDLGGDWLLNEVFEQGKVVKQEINLSQIYFKSKLLHEWSGVFPLAVDVGVTDRSINNVLTDEPLLLNFPAPQDIYSTTTVTTGNADSPGFGASISVGSTKMVAVGKGIIEFFDYAGSRWARTSSFTTADKVNPLVACMWEGQNLAIIGYPKATSNQGSISCYQYADAAWSSIAVPFNLPSLTSGDLFGCAVAASSNYLAIGASGTSSTAGAVYVYTIGSINPITLTASLPSELSFGQAIAIENTRLVIGSTATSNQGCVYIFDYNGTTWVQTQRIVADDAVNNQYFGCSVALSGDRIVVGAYGDNSNAGAIYIFEKGIGSSPWIQIAKLIPTDVASGDKFGLAIALQGNVIVASSPQKNTRDSSFASVSGAGQIYFLERKTNGWTFVNSMTKPGLLSANDAAINAGSSVALNQRYAFIGIPGDDTQATNAGKLLTYQIKDASTALEHYNNMNVDADQTATIVDGSSGVTRLEGAYDVKVIGKYTYIISTTDKGLSIFDTSDPYSPTLVKDFDLGVIPSAFDLYGNYIYVASTTGSCIKVVDMTTQNMTSVSLPGVGMIKIANGQLYAHVNTSLQRYDLSSSATLGSSPSIYSNTPYLAGSPNPNGIYIEGNYLYIVNTPNKITILNITNTPPTVAKEITGVTANPKAIAVKNNYLYVLGNTGNSIQIYDVSDLNNLTLVKTLSQITDGNYLVGLTSIAIENWHAYVSSTSSNAVTIINIVDPPNAYVEKELVYSTNGITGLRGVQGICISNNYLYTADGVGKALTILKVHTPTRGLLNRVLHFNGSNQFIKLPSFSLPSQAITLEARFYLKSLPIGNTPLFDLANGTGSNNISLYISNQNLTFEIYQGGTSGSLTSNTIIALCTWYHVAVTVTNAGSAAIYINGQLDVSGNLAIPNSLTRSSNYIAAANGSFAPGSTPFFYGMMREARIWSAALTQKQVLNNLRSTLSGSEANLLAYYPFNEESGSIVYDLSQQKRHAILGANVSSLGDKPTRIFGNDPFTFKYSLAFNGVSSVVTIPHNNTLNVSSLTLSVWVRTTLNTTTQVGIISKYTTDSGYQIYMVDGVVWARYYNSSSKYIAAFSGGFIADGQWNYISFTVINVTGSSGGGRLYVNGALKGSTTWFGSPTAVASTQNLTIGSDGATFFAGEIAEVSIWNTSLSQPDIKKYMQSRPLGSESNLVAYYNFSEGTGTTLTDLSSNSFNGTIASSTWRKAINASQTLTSQALYSNTNGFYATVPHSNAFNTIPMSVGFWFNYDKGNPGNFHEPIKKISSTSGNVGYHIFSNSGATGKLTFSHYSSAGWIGGGSVSTGNIDDGRSHYMVLTASAKVVSIYIDGILVSSVDGSNTPTFTLGTSSNLTDLYLGKVKGLLNNVSFWNRVLTPKEVQTYMFKPIPSTSISGLVANYNFSELNGQYIYDSSGNGYHGYLGNSPATTASDSLYVMSLTRSRERCYLASNKYTVLFFNTYHPDSNNSSILIKAPPSQGMLYQYDATAPNYCGAQITSNNTALLDTSQRAVYYPNMTGASSYDTVNFNYSCYDGTYETSPSTVYINLYAPIAISGTVAGQTVTDTTTKLPFTNVVLTKVDLSTAWTYTITSNQPDFGTLAGTLGSYNVVSVSKGVYTLSGVSRSVAEADIRSVVFTPELNKIAIGATKTITFTIACSDGSVADNTTTVVVTPIKDPAVLTPMAPILAAITEDQINNSGQLVSSILGSSLSTPDLNAVQGIAIIDTAITSGPGTGVWQYRLDSTSTWNPVGTVSNTSARLLRAIDYIRFVPDGRNGCAATITYQGWDQTSGIFGNTANASINGGTTAFSTATDVATITVNSVNDAPKINSPIHAVFNTITEDNINDSGKQIAALIASSITDDDSAALTGIAITGVSITGGGLRVWQYSIDNGSNWISVEPVSDTNALLLYTSDYIRFMPDAENGCVATLTYRAWDQTSGTHNTKVDVSTNGGTTAFSNTTDIATITVVDVKDAPTLIPTAPILASITEDQINNSGQTVSSILGTSAQSVDLGVLLGMAITKAEVVSGSGTGIWQYSIDGGANWLAVGSVSNTSALLLRATNYIRFVPDGKNGCLAILTYRAWDQTLAAYGVLADTSSNGGATVYSSATDTATLTVSSINDAPQISSPINPTFNTITEDDVSNGIAKIAVLIGSSITDDDSTPLAGVAITGVSISGNGSGLWLYSIDNGLSWKLIGTVSDTNALLLHTSDYIRFIPDTKNSCVGTLTYRAWDQTSGTHNTKVNVSISGGSTAFSSNTDTASITVTDVNDAPSLIPSASNLILPKLLATDVNNTGTPVALLTGTSLSDVDFGAIQGVVLTAADILTGAGTWQYSTDVGANWTDFPSVSSTAALLLRSIDRVRFLPDGSTAATASITYQGWDQTSGTGGSTTDASVSGGTTAFSLLQKTALITVTVNHAPIIQTPIHPTLPTITAKETSNTGTDITTLIKSSITDLDPEAVKGIAIVETSVDSGNGTWQYSLDQGATWNAISSISTTSALLLCDDHRIRFLPDGTYQAKGSFNYYAWDRTTGTPGYTADVSVRGGSKAFSTTSDTATIRVKGLHAPWNINPTVGPTLYTLGDAPVIVDFGIVQTDTALTEEGAIIIIQITAGAHENDMITIDPLGTGPGQINVVGNYIKYGSIAIGTYSGAVKGASNLCIRLNSNATQAAINAAMQRISFSNEDVTAPIEDRTVTYTYSDNASTTHAATKIVNVISASASAPPASAVVAIPTITYIYNKLATALQYPRSFVLINKYIRSFFSFR